MARSSYKKTKRNWAEKLHFHSIMLGRSTSVFRNLRDSFFPERLSEKNLKLVRDRLCTEVVDAHRALGNQAFALTVGKEGFAQEVDRLLGYGLVTPSFVAHGTGGAIVSVPEAASVIINDEDHLTIRSSSAVTFSEQWSRVNVLEKALGKRMAYAYNETYGYLSANPEHVGLGVRLTGSFCLFGLYLMKEMDSVLYGLERLGFSVTPMFVLSEQEESPLDTPGCSYRIHLTQMHGRIEDMIERAELVFAELARQEENARFRLRAERNEELTDFILRSIGVSTLSVQIGESEGIDMVSAIIFGLDMDVLQVTDPELLDNLYRILLQVTGPGIRQKVSGGISDADRLSDYRRARATLIRQVSLQLLATSLERLSNM